MKLLFVLGLFGLSAHAAEISTTCSTEIGSSTAACSSHTTEQSCAGLSEVVIQACQGYNKITFSNETFQDSCEADQSGSFVQYTCSNP